MCARAALGGYGRAMALINSDLTGRVSAFLAGPGPSIDQRTGHGVVAQLHAQALRAPHIVSDIAHLDSAANLDVPVLVVSRQSWSKVVADSFEDLFGGVSEQNWLEAAALSTGLGASLAVMARSTLGQFLPFGGESTDGGRGRLLLVAPNILAFQRTYGLDRRDLALWVSVHELTHAAQFAAAPWLEGFIVSRARSLLQAQRDGEQIVLTDGAGGEVSAVMSLLEGHAEHVMNAVPIAQMPGKNRLIAAIGQRRSSGGALKRAINRSMGLQAKLSQYSSGATFVAEVVKAVGYDGLNAVWESPLNAPSLEEIAAPQAWINRMR